MDDSYRKVGKDKVIQIGPVLVESSKSVVYDGRFDERRVAVKLILTANKNLSKELQALRIVNHKNVVRYLYNDTGEAGQSLYIVLELCTYTLRQFINDNLIEVSLEPYEVLKQITDGLHYLHSVQDLIHRDLKPSNILLVEEDKSWVVKISDFDISTQLQPDKTSATLTSAKGTVGYVAPEILNGGKISKEADIFSLGVVFYYVLSGGEHPYGGDTLTLDKNISDENCSPKIDGIKADYNIDTKSLIERMIRFKSKDRPKVNQVRAHHIFWDKERGLFFFEGVSNLLTDKNVHQALVNKLEKDTDEACGRNWLQTLSGRYNGTQIGEALNRQKGKIGEALNRQKGKIGEAVNRQNGNHCTVHGLLRKIRNWKSHFYDKQTKFRGEIEGENYAGLLKLFTSNFPKLLSHTYDVMMTESLKDPLQKYYDVNALSSTEPLVVSRSSEVSVNKSAEPEPMEVQYSPSTEMMTTDVSSRKRDYDGQIRTEPIELRKYQLELVQQALGGSNSLIIAPTGSGKTAMANEVMKYCLMKFNEKHVLFFVSKTTLAVQQWKFFKRHLPGYSITYITGKDAIDIDVALELKAHNVTVLTPQIWINELRRTPAVITFADISLMVFDECHHATKRHPYKEVMDMLLSSSEHLPNVQILGLTASPGVGKGGGNKVEKKLLDLLAGLNVFSCPVTVIENIDELKEHQHEIKETYFPVESKEDDFTRKLLDAIDSLEKAISELANACLGDAEMWLTDPPKEKAKQSYEQWTNDVIKYAKLEVKDPELSCKIREHAENLNIYHNWLILKDVIPNVIDYTMEFHETRPAIDESELGKRNQGLRDLSHHVEVPMLQKLMEILKAEFAKRPDGRCMIFVERKLTAQCLVKSIKSTELAALGPEYLIGGKNTELSSGMTEPAQNSVLRMFHDGKCKVLVATSIGEEGIDVPSCNLVISYHYVTGEVGTIQRAGRGRAAKSKSILIALVDSGHIEREKKNKIYAEATESAIQKIQKRSLETLRKEILSLQGAHKIMRKNKDVIPGPISQDPASKWRIICKCHNPITSGDRLYHIENTHTVIIDAQFEERVIRDVGRKDKGNGIVGTADFLCNKCKLKLALNMTYNERQYPTLSLKKVIFQHENGERRIVKKKRSLPFKICKSVDEVDSDDEDSVNQDENMDNDDIIELKALDDDL